MAFACPEPPSAMSAERSAGVRDGMQAFAFGTTETTTYRPGRKKRRSKPSQPPRHNCSERNSRRLPKKWEPGAQQLICHLSATRTHQAQELGFPSTIIREERRHIGRPSRKTTACFARHSHSTHWFHLPRLPPVLRTSISRATIVSSHTPGTNCALDRRKLSRPILEVHRS